MLEIEEYDIETIWKILAAILHLGNLDFEERESEGEETCYIIEKEMSGIDKISMLLSVSPFNLRNALLNKSIKV